VPAVLPDVGSDAVIDFVGLLHGGRT
jgi:hypothetical protein